MSTSVLAAPAKAALPRSWRRALVEALAPSVKAAPILLLGSRAVGDAGASSDCDVAVVLPWVACARLAPKLGRAATGLTEQLGVRVTVGPLPAARLAEPGGSLYLLKVHREAVQIAGRQVELRRDCAVGVSRLAAASYAVSTVITMLEATGLDSASEAAAHAVRKATLHVAQLRLLDRRLYASTLAEAVELLDDAELRELAACPSRAGALSTARSMVLRESARRPFHVPRHRVPARNAQAAALSALRGAPCWAGAWRGVATEELLARLLCALLESPDPGQVPEDVRLGLALPRDASWLELRDLARERWERAHALGGVLR